MLESVTLVRPSVDFGPVIDQLAVGLSIQQDTAASHDVSEVTDAALWVFTLDLMPRFYVPQNSVHVHAGSH